jgi:hypothetical protein
METVYDHLKGNPTFTVTAAETWSITMIKKLQQSYPDEVDVITNKDGTLLAHLPFEWMRIIPKKKRNLTEEQKSAIAERLKKGRK